MKISTTTKWYLAFGIFIYLAFCFAFGAAVGFYG